MTKTDQSIDSTSDINWRNLPQVVRLLSPAMIFGSALHWIWIYTILYSSYPALINSEINWNYILNSLCVIPLGFTLITAIVMAVIGARITYFIRMRSVQICAAVMMSFGTVLLFQSQQLNMYPLTIIVYAICGVAVGFFLLIWSEVFRRQETQSIVLNSVLGQVVAFVGAALLMLFVSERMVAVLLSFLPLLEVALLLFALHGFNALSKPQKFEYDESGIRVAAPGLLEIPTFHRLNIKRPLFIAKMGLPSFLFGLGLGPLCSWCFHLLSGLSVLDNYSIGLIIIAGLVAAAVVILLMLINRNYEYDSFYRFMIPILAITLFFTSFVNDTYPLTMTVIISFLLFQIMIWVEFCEMSHRYRISPILVSGTGFGFLMIGMLVGSGMMLAFEASPNFELNPSLFSSLVIIAMLLGYFLMPRSRAIMEISIVEKESHAGEEGTLEEGEIRRGRFLRRCEKVANTYLLSNREVDVFYLLAKGRNAAYIAHKLYIAEGTVNTHTWRIYKKLNVHSQQELMELVDDMLLEGEEDKQDTNPPNPSNPSKV